jgi:hypothetical protein
MAPAEEFSVLAHELAHEMLHHRKDAAPPSKLVRETQAEAVAFVVCRGVGLETNTAAADYIALYNGDKKTLAESLSVIQETSAKILDELLPEKHMTRVEQRQPSTMMPESVRPEPTNNRPAELPERLASESTHSFDDSPAWDR